MPRDARRASSGLGFRLLVDRSLELLEATPDRFEFALEVGDGLGRNWRARRI
jgi:hypothetical protein